MLSVSSIKEQLVRFHSAVSHSMAGFGMHANVQMNGKDRIRRLTFDDFGPAPVISRSRSRHGKKRKVLDFS